MGVKEILKREIEIIEPKKTEIAELEKHAGKLIKVLEKELRHVKGSPETFLGGSFAKGTFLKKD